MILTLGQVAEGQGWLCAARGCTRGLIPLEMCVPAVARGGKQSLICLSCAEDALDDYGPPGDPALAPKYGITYQHRDRLLSLLEVAEALVVGGEITKSDWRRLNPSRSAETSDRFLERLKQWVDRKQLWPSFGVQRLDGLWVFKCSNVLGFIELLNGLLDSLAVLHPDADDDRRRDYPLPWAFYRRKIDKRTASP